MLIMLFDLIVVVTGLGPMVEKFAGWRHYRRMPFQWLGKCLMARGWAHGWADGRSRRLARSGIVYAGLFGGKLSARFVTRMAAQGSPHFSGTA